MHTTYSLWCGERGIQTPGTDKPFTGFRVRPNRSLWHLSQLLELPTKVRKKIEKGSLQIPVAPSADSSIKYNNVTRVMIGLHLATLPTSEALPILNIVERMGFPLWVVVLYLFTSRSGFVQDSERPVLFQFIIIPTVSIHGVLYISNYFPLL